MGQFTNHDITFDQTSPAGGAAEPVDLAEARTPALDLSSVFGGGPALSRTCMWPTPTARVAELKIGPSVGPGGAVHEDIPRVANDDGSYSAVFKQVHAVDENMIIAELHYRPHPVLQPGTGREGSRASTSVTSRPPALVMRPTRTWRS